MNSVIEPNRITSTLLVATTLLLVGSAFAQNDANTRYGVGSLPGNAKGKSNTAIGYQVMFRDQTIGNGNTAVGAYALTVNAFGDDNVAIGSLALPFASTGSRNTVIGTKAVLQTPPSDLGSDNIVMGFQAGMNLGINSNHNIDIGSGGVTADSNTIRVGDSNQTRTFVAGINGVAVSGAGVVVNADGQLGVAASSARFKDDIRPIENRSEAIFGLKPVSFHYKKDIDPAGIPQFGLVAEDVAKVNPDLVLRDKDDKPYTVRYDQVNAMLLNEFLKEHKAFLEEHRTVEELKKQVAALTAAVQKVSVRLELSKPAPHTVLK
jgi:hypothetical protein